MLEKDQIKNIAVSTILTEAETINSLTGIIDDNFVSIVELLFNCNGRIIVTGIGKSAIIAEKIVATFNSTGTPSVFMHAADAIHGDLGIIRNDDIVVCLSKSGNTPEIKVLVPLIKSFGNKLIGIVSNKDSFLAQHSDYVLLATVKKEACPNNIVPTSSTTAQLVIGDALAVCLLESRGFSLDDFARVHPGGTIGKKLYMRVDDIFTRNEKPSVKLNDSIKTVIIEMTTKRLGATAVLNSDNSLAGIITDGDLRRMLQKNIHIENLIAEEIMNKNPKTVSNDAMAIEAFNIMEDNKITQLVVVDKNQFLGMIHLHDILREGIV